MIEGFFVLCSGSWRSCSVAFFVNQGNIGLLMACLGLLNLGLCSGIEMA